VQLRNREQRRSQMDSGGDEATGVPPVRHRDTMTCHGWVSSLRHRFTHKITSGRNLLKTIRCFIEH
jgi:hypothetical protein